MAKRHYDAAAALRSQEADAQYDRVDFLTDILLGALLSPFDEDESISRSK